MAKIKLKQTSGVFHSKQIINKIVQMYLNWIFKTSHLRNLDYQVPLVVALLMLRLNLWKKI